MTVNSPPLEGAALRTLRRTHHFSLFLSLYGTSNTHKHSLSLSISLYLSLCDTQTQQFITGTQRRSHQHPTSLSLSLNSSLGFTHHSFPLISTHTHSLSPFHSIHNLFPCLLLSKEKNLSFIETRHGPLD